MDYSTSCNSTNTTVEQLTALNHDNLGFYSTIRDLSIIGLVERGGGCNWSEKVYMARSLSSAINLNLTAIVISDNERPASADYNPYPITTISQQKYTFTNPLPDDRNATHMQDNDLHTTFGTTTTPPIGIYFIPETYGDHLRSLIGDNTTVGNDERPLLQLSLIFSPIRLQSSEGDDANVFTRGYLSYVIALSVILFVGRSSSLMSSQHHHAYSIMQQFVQALYFYGGGVYENVEQQENTRHSLVLMQPTCKCDEKASPCLSTLLMRSLLHIIRRLLSRIQVVRFA